jgi:hypothetical protein
MENAAIRSHKAHMWCDGRPARTAGLRVASPARARGRGDMPEDVSPAACQGFAAACMVDASARREAGVGCVRRVTAETAAGPVRASGRLARAAARRAADRAGAADGREAGTAARRAPSATGSAVPLPVRGHKRGTRSVTCSAWHRAIGKGQEAYFASDGTGSRGISRSPWLSLHESLLSARDLPSTTLSNELCMQSNIFRFVMT